MKKLLLFIALALLACPAYAGSERPREAPRSLSAGSLAPDFTLRDLQDREVRLSQLRGKVVIVNFWATWCPPCKAEMPSMEVLHKTFKDQDLVLLAINVEKDGRRAVNEFLKESPYTFPILFDTESQVQNQYGVFQYPESFIIDRNGVIVRKVIGAVHWTGGDLFNLVRFMIEG